MLVAYKLVRNNKKRLRATLKLVRAYKWKPLKVSASY